MLSGRQVEHKTKLFFPFNSPALQQNFQTGMRIFASFVFSLPTSALTILLPPCSFVRPVEVKFK